METFDAELEVEVLMGGAPSVTVVAAVGLERFEDEAVAELPCVWSLATEAVS